MTKSKNKKPQYRYIKINETQYWEDEFVNKLGINGVIWAVYAYDSSVHTYCCELIPSYEMIYLGTEFSTDTPYSESINFEQIEEEIMECERNSNYSYMHCSAIDRFISYPLNGNYETDDDVMEQYVANPGVFDCVDRTLTLEQLKKDVMLGKYNYTNPSSINFINALTDVFRRKYKRIKFEKIKYAQELAWDIVCGDSFFNAIVLMERFCKLLSGKNPFGED